MDAQYVRIEVTNDAAERGVKNAQEVADAARDPNLRENILQVMTDHRSCIGRIQKANLNQING